MFFRKKSNLCRSQVIFVATVLNKNLKQRSKAAAKETKNKKQ